MLPPDQKFRWNRLQSDGKFDKGTCRMLSRM